MIYFLFHIDLICYCLTFEPYNLFNEIRIKIVEREIENHK